MWKMGHNALIRVSGLQVIYIQQGYKGGPGPWLIQSIQPTHQASVDENEISIASCRCEISLL
jgi:hypothetical protein